LFCEETGARQYPSIGNNNDHKDIVTISATDGNVQQAWMTIARRNYFGLAEFWWDKLGVSPIGVVNRQGMSPLQFAARSGHCHMVQWFLQHPFDSDIESSNDDGNNKGKKMTVLEWVQQKDQRGQTAVTAAQVNQHHEVVRILEEYIKALSQS
jgi:ankyrin repeat protein